MSMNKDNSAVALVTGASTGIGQVTAKALKQAGFQVFGTSRRPATESSDGVAGAGHRPRPRPRAAR